MSEFQIHEVTKEDLQQIAVVGTHLHKWQGESTEDIQSVFKQQALVQLDPLNPAGRNHDLFFQSRIKNYEIDTFQKIVYPKKLVFEAYFPNLMAISKEHFPLFLSQMKKEYLHKYYQSRLEKVEKIHSGILDEAVKFLQKNGPSTASDIGEIAKIKPDFSFWKTSNLAGMSLEILWILGRVIISDRDENWRKIYNLTEEYFESVLLEKTDLTHEEISYEKFLIKQKSYPLITLGKVSISKAGESYLNGLEQITQIRVLTS
ncbi:MAG: DNA glycosylase AlkZ-like family protein [Candidatus Heimdallarchaeaceae archaeon]